VKRSLLWKLCLVVGIGAVLLLYLVSQLSTRAQEQMSYLSEEHKQQLSAYAQSAQQLYIENDLEQLAQLMRDIQQREDSWAAVVKSDLQSIAGGELSNKFYQSYGIGRGIQWKLHSWLVKPVMEIDISERNVHFLIQLPDRMRPSIFQYMGFTHLLLHLVLPLILLTAISFMLYLHINSPLRQLQIATRQFSEGRFDVRVRGLMGNRTDELAELASTFDKMAVRISDLITNQRQLISDLSHELRTPLTRLDIAVATLKGGHEPSSDAAIARVERESEEIRKLVEDTLALAWLENERPSLTQEDLDLVDLLDVVVEDARFEFPDRRIESEMPESAPVSHSNHRALGQALENIIRNAMRYTPPGKVVSVLLEAEPNNYQIHIADQGPGVPEQHLEKIFQPFYRLDAARSGDSSGFGLGLALAQRQITAIGGEVVAHNRQPCGLLMSISLPRNS